MKKKRAVQLVYCFDCEKTFTAGNAQRKREVVRRHLEDHSSYRTIQRRDGCSRNTAVKLVHALGREVKDSFWIAKHLHPTWRGVLCVDGTYVRVRNAFKKLAQREGWYKGEEQKFLHKLIALLGVDYHTRDLPHYAIGDNENMIDMVLFFQQLRENAYPLKALVRDGNRTIEAAARHVYGTPFPSQLCHHHFLAKFDDVIALRDCEEKERTALIELKRRVCMVIRVPDIQLACRRVNEFHREQNRFRTSALASELVDKLFREFENLTMYLQYPKGFLPTTVNVSENINKQIKERFKPMCMFQSIASAENYLKLWCLKRRFQKFTDCRKPFRHLNGKAPLELAGCRINGLDYLNL
jgi:hypothetical protein